MCRSREGAWIEIPLAVYTLLLIIVAPVRERGLKLKNGSDNITSGTVAPVRERGLK